MIKKAEYSNMSRGISEYNKGKVLLPVSKSFNYDPTYANTILRNNFNREIIFALKSSVFGSNGRQQEVNVCIFESLCGFMCQISVEECLQPCTFPLAMHLIAVAMSKTTFIRSDFEMMCCACLLIASKLQDICPPSIGTLSEAFGRRFGEEKLIRMEQRLLAESFKLDISIPTRLDFSSIFIKAGQLSDKERLLVDFLVDLSYLDFNLFYIRASKVSAACVHLALQMLRQQSEELWNNALLQASGYAEEDFVEAVLRLRKLHWGCAEEKSKYITDKYSSEDSLFVSEVTAISYGNLRFDTIKLPKSECKISLLQYSHGEGFSHGSLGQSQLQSQMITPKPTTASATAALSSSTSTSTSTSTTTATSSAAESSSRATMSQAIPMKRVYPFCK